MELAFLGSEKYLKANSKYLLVALLLLPIIVVLGMVSLAEVFLAGSIGLLGGSTILLKPEVEKAMRKAKIDRLYKETPLDLVVTCNRFFLIAFFACSANVIMTNFNFGVGAMPFGSDQMLFLGIAFFMLGMVFVFRIGEFVLRPKASSNIIYGKITYWFSEIGMRVSMLALLVFFQIINATMFYGTLIGKITLLGTFYDAFIILSFISMFPLIWGILYRLKDKFRRKDLAVIIGFFLPWFYLFGVSILFMAGILN